jgi:hypothetical protein
MQIDPTGHKAGFWSVYNAMMVGYLANLVLPRAGEVVRCTVLKRTDAIPVKVSLGTVITERVIDVLILFSFITLTFFVEFDKLHDFFTGYLNDKYQSYPCSGGTTAPKPEPAAWISISTRTASGRSSCSRWSARWSVFRGICRSMSAVLSFRPGR